jgi:kynureninase
MNRQEAEQLDQCDLLAGFREKFNLPNGTIYLCGHSLGPMLKTASCYVAEIMEQQWGQEAICAWNNADWINMPKRLGDKISTLIGADADEVIVADSITANLFKLLMSGLKLRAGRNVILTDIDNFPADIYMAQAVADLFPDTQLIRCHRADIPRFLNQKTAILMLTHVDYRTSEIYDIREMTRLGHAAGALVLFDLAHSVGVMPLELSDTNVDMAVGCGYKYLNGGPGAPAFIYVAKKHHDRMQSPLLGWMGHASPFDFGNEYVPAQGIKRFLCGTPPILSMCVLEEAVDMLLPIPLSDIHMKSQRLSNYLIKLICKKCPELQIVSPINSRLRGSHVAITHSHAYGFKQALSVEGIICDYREPDLIRFGLSSLYVRYVDLYDTVISLEKIINKKSYQHPDFNVRAIVT